MAKIADFPWGFLASYDDNEIEVVSTISDPPKVRLAVMADKVESNLGCVSFNLRRADGRHEEMAYMMGRLTAGGKAAAIYWATRAEGEEQARERFFLDHNGAHFRVPVHAPNLGGQAGSEVGAGSHELVSPSNTLRLSLLDTGQVVVYDMTRPAGQREVAELSVKTRFR